MTDVLIVDDEEDIRVLLRRTLERMDGIVVTGEAASGGEAFELWETLAPDLIVLDQRMPGETGLELARRIVAERPHQLIVLFTAGWDLELVRQATEAGVSATLSKTELRRLPDVVTMLLREGSRRGGEPTS